MISRIEYVDYFVENERLIVNIDRRDSVAHGLIDDNEDFEFRASQVVGTSFGEDDDDSKMGFEKLQLSHPQNESFEASRELAYALFDDFVDIEHIKKRRKNIYCMKYVHGQTRFTSKLSLWF